MSNSSSNSTRNKRIDRGKVARGGVSQRKSPSKGATWLHEQQLDKGPRVLDFGCGYGIDADAFSWHKYDPYYFPQDLGQLEPFDTIICTYVISAVSQTVAESIVMDEIFGILKPGGTAYFIVPRNLPKNGKLSGYARRPQSNVIMTGNGVTSVHLEEKKYEIYAVTSPEDVVLSGFYREGGGGNRR